MLPEDRGKNHAFRAWLCKIMDADQVDRVFIRRRLNTGHLLRSDGSVYCDKNGYSNGRRSAYRIYTTELRWCQVLLEYGQFEDLGDVDPVLYDVGLSQW
jgi:hypothetical protein